MSFEKYLTEQIKMHGSMQPQDIVKLCFQAAYGAEHLLAGMDAAREYFEKEYEAAEPRDTVLYEYISDSVCRINLAAWKFNNLPREQLFSIFALSAKAGQGDKDKLSGYLERAEGVLEKTDISFTQEEWKMYLSEYIKKGMPAVHHSQIYRKCERPAYRIADVRYIRQINQEKKKKYD